MAKFGMFLFFLLFIFIGAFVYFSFFGGIPYGERDLGIPVAPKEVGFSDYSTLRWEPSSSSSSPSFGGYILHYGKIKGKYTDSLKMEGTEVSCPFYRLSLEDGETYYVVVSAYSNAGESGYSSPVRITIPVPGVDITSPLVVAGVSAKLRGDVIEIKWTENRESDIAEYFLYYGTRNREYGVPISVGMNTHYSFSNFEKGKEYFFAVTAVDSSGNEGGFSSPEVSVSVS